MEITYVNILRLDIIHHWYQFAPANPKHTFSSELWIQLYKYEEETVTADCQEDILIFYNNCVNLE